MSKLPNWVKPNAYRNAFLLKLTQKQSRNLSLSHESVSFRGLLGGWGNGSDWVGQGPKRSPSPSWGDHTQV